MTVVFAASGAHMSVLKFDLLCAGGTNRGPTDRIEHQKNHSMFKALNNRTPDR